VKSDCTNFILTLYKIYEMNLTIEIENKEDLPFIIKLIESLKGVKNLSKTYEENFADNLKDEDFFSKEDFFSIYR
jgi:hypothetical protein